MAFPIYSDENAMHGVLLKRLRPNSVSCSSSNEAGNGGLSDEEQLVYATERGAAILTFDRGDFSALHSRWMHLGRSHSGILIVRSSRIGASALFDQLIRLQHDRTPADMRNAILFLGPQHSQEHT